MSGHSFAAITSMLVSRCSTALATCSTAPGVDDNRDARQSGNRLKVTWPCSQYHRATNIPGGSTRA